MEIMKVSLLFVLLIQLCDGQNIANIEDISLANYSKVATPYLSNPNKTVDVYISMFILNIGNLNTKEMTFETEMYFEMKWKDPRLAFQDYHNATYALVSGETAYEKIWVPDLFVRNMKEVENSKFLTDLSGVTINPDGLVELSSRIRVVAHCEMDLFMFPFDSQSCNIMITSYLYNTAVLSMYWSENPVVIDEKRDGRETKIEGFMGFQLTRSLTREDSYLYPLSGLRYQYMIATFVLKREPQYYILRGFIPSSLLVCLTWASFWLPTSSYPARVALIVTSFLASIVLYQGSTLHSIQMTVMQVFLFGNISFIMVTLMEFLMAVKADHEKKEKTELVPTIRNELFNSANETQENEFWPKEKKNMTSAVDVGKNQTNENERKSTTRNKEKTENSVDRKARFIIPILYLIYVGVFVAALFFLNQE
ncbi:pH-sensitive chloride channel 2-like [Clytia hemisphaerica]|uniref:Neurotransmitter-gated ion-channel ligand-binding domain-containing protein n=1 Tax=Clytia hemisphaerica TaxID=252671 RepID=A0A7M5WX23_9CNID